MAVLAAGKRQGYCNRITPNGSLAGKDTKQGSYDSDCQSVDVTSQNKKKANANLCPKRSCWYPRLLCRLLRFQACHTCHHSPSSPNYKSHSSCRCAFSCDNMLLHGLCFCRWESSAQATFGFWQFTGQPSSRCQCPDY